MHGALPEIIFVRKAGPAKRECISRESSSGHIDGSDKSTSRPLILRREGIKAAPMQCLRRSPTREAGHASSSLQQGLFGCNSFRSRSLANQTHDNRDWNWKPNDKSQIRIDVPHSRKPLMKGERLVHYAVNIVLLGNVGSHSCTSF